MNARNPFTRAFSWLAFVFCIAVGTAHADRGGKWGVIELGAFNPEQGSASFNLNNRGDVVGRSFIGCCAFQHAFIWQNGALLDINPPGIFNSRAFGVANNGTVVVEASPNKIYTWRDGTFTELPFDGFPNEIGNDGTVVGGYSTSWPVASAERPTTTPELFTSLAMLPALPPGSVPRSRITPAW